MIGDLIINYKELGITGISIILMVWLVKYLIRQANEDRIYYRNMVNTDLQNLHDDSLKNADLNNQSIILIKDMNQNLEKHNGHTEKAWEKTIDSLQTICDRLNGGNPAMVKMKKELEYYKTRGVVDRRKENKPIEVERRK